MVTAGTSYKLARLEKDDCVYSRWKHTQKQMDAHEEVPRPSSLSTIQRSVFVSGTTPFSQSAQGVLYPSSDHSETLVSGEMIHLIMIR